MEERVQGCHQGHPEGGRATKLGLPSRQTSSTPCLGSKGVSSSTRAQGRLEESPSSEDRGDGCDLLQRCWLHTSSPKPLAPCTRAGGRIETDARQKQSQFPPHTHPQLPPPCLQSIRAPSWTPHTTACTSPGVGSLPQPLRRGWWWGQRVSSQKPPGAAC